MTKFKDFGSGASESERDQIKFKLFDQEFSCRPVLSGKSFIDIAKMSSGEDTLAAIESLEKFFELALFKEDLERFNALLVDPERVVSLEMLNDIVAWLMEVYTERPNQLPEN
jgi:hypothetical protein